MEIPYWINREDWDAFIEMRKKIKSPMTDRAKQLAIGALERLMRAGEDPNLVLQQSEFKCWKGLFPLADDFKQMVGIDPIGASNEASRRFDQPVNQADEALFRKYPHLRPQ